LAAEAQSGKFSVSPKPKLKLSEVDSPVRKMPETAVGQLYGVPAASRDLASSDGKHACQSIPKV